MTQIVEFPVMAGGVLRVQAVDDTPPRGDGQELVPASGAPRDQVRRAGETLEAALSSVTPALEVITRQLRRLSPHEVTLEFGLVLGVEHGVVIAKGKGEVHFTVTLVWRATDEAASTPQATAGSPVTGTDRQGGND
jgi:Trypsin-co-occurring domain 1